MYAQRAERLYRAYKSCDSIADIPGPEKAKIEKTIFKMSFEEVWSITEAYWSDRDPAEVARAEKDGKHKMALCFRWYLGMTSRWARTGEKTRKRDFQIWCGPSMGAFNDWVKGSWLEPLEARDVVSVAHALMDGVAALGNAHAAGQSAVSAVPPRR